MATKESSKKDDQQENQDNAEKAFQPVPTHFTEEQKATLDADHALAAERLEREQIAMNSTLAPANVRAQLDKETRELQHKEVDSYMKNRPLHVREHRMQTVGVQTGEPIKPEIPISGGPNAGDVGGTADVEEEFTGSGARGKGGSGKK